jgi:hypothetical protein
MRDHEAGAKPVLNRRIKGMFLFQRSTAMRPEDLMKPDILSEVLLLGGALAFALALVMIVVVAVHPITL